MFSTFCGVARSGWAGFRRVALQNATSSPALGQAMGLWVRNCPGAGRVRSVSPGSTGGLSQQDLGNLGPL